MRRARVSRARATEKPAARTAPAAKTCEVGRPYARHRRRLKVRGGPRQIVHGRGCGKERAGCVSHVTPGGGCTAPCLRITPLRLARAVAHLVGCATRRGREAEIIPY